MVDIDIHQGARFKAKSDSAFFSQRSGLATDFSKTTQAHEAGQGQANGISWAPRKSVEPSPPLILKNPVTVTTYLKMSEQ